MNKGKNKERENGKTRETKERGNGNRGYVNGINDNRVKLKKGVDRQKKENMRRDRRIDIER